MRLQVGNQVIEFKVPGSLKGLVLAGFLALLAYCVFNSVYTVELDEQAVVTRFGKYVETVSPGLHFLVPFIDKAEPKEVLRVHKMEFGFGTKGSRNPNQVSSLDEMLQEKSMVTGDLNAATVEWVVQYKISDLKAFLFNVREPEGTLRDASEAIMREVVGDRTVDEVITIGRQEIETLCHEKLSELARLYDLGISIDQVQLKNVNPPKEVQSSFTEVNNAQQEKEKSVNEANGQYNKAVPKAGGDAAKMISEAQGYASKRVNEAEGDVAKFVALYGEYQKSPAVTRRRIYLETMEKVMPNMGKKIIVDEGVNQVLPILPLESMNSKN